MKTTKDRIVMEPVRASVLLTISQVADILHCSLSHIYAMRNAGTFPQPIRLGTKSVRWEKSDIDAFISNRKGE